MGRINKFLLLPALLTSAVAVAQSGGERAYAIDPASSDIHWLTYKAGTFQKLGHNHVISVARPTGTVSVSSGDLAKSRFEIAIPVAGLVVDNPDLRKNLGADFSSVPTADDIAGTTKNMLGDKVLEAAKFPEIKVRGTGPLGEPGKQTMKMTVELLGRSIDLTVPTEVTVDEQGVRARGSFDLTHSDLGMQPFSVMLGAIQVADKMTFSYDIHAKPTAR